MEGAPKTPAPEKNETFHHDIEDVVVHATETRRECQLHPFSPGCEPELLHNEIEQSDVSELFNHYEDHKIVKLADITGSIARIVDHLSRELHDIDPESEEGRFITTRFNLLKSRDQELRSAVQRYVRTLSQFFNLKKQRVRMEPEEFVYQMEETDTRRRAAHDALIETLTIYTRIINELQSEDMLEGFIVLPWRQGMELADAEDSVSIVFSFSPSVLQDRDLVKDWAVTAHLSDELALAREAKKKALESERQDSVER